MGLRIVLKIFDVMPVCSNVRTYSLALEAKDRDKNCLAYSTCEEKIRLQNILKP